MKYIIFCYLLLDIDFSNVSRPRFTNELEEADLKFNLSMQPMSMRW